MLLPRKVIPLVALLLAACTGEIGNERYPRGEAPGGWDGAASVRLDTGATAPDATEADAGSEDAVAAWPDAHFAPDARFEPDAHFELDAGSVHPDAQPAYPDAQPAYPDAQPAYPDAQPTYPDAQPTYPDAQPTYPDAQVTYPDASAPMDAGQPMSGTVTDSAGQVYRTVQIGNQVWMAENLNTNVSGSSYYMDNSSHAATYGRLYSQSAAMQACMSGWRLPSDQDWMQLEAHLGMSQADLSRDWSQTERRGTNQGGRLKETGTARWFSPNNGATNDTGFGARPGGFRGYGGGYGGLGEDGRYWSTSASRYFRADRANLNRYLGGPEYRFSVRCIRN